jgi:hypothetical protein
MCIGGNGLGSKLLGKLPEELVVELQEVELELELEVELLEELTNRGVNVFLKAPAAELLVFRFANLSACPILSRMESG